MACIKHSHKVSLKQIACHIQQSVSYIYTKSILHITVLLRMIKHVFKIWFVLLLNCPALKGKALIQYSTQTTSNTDSVAAPKVNF